jgi:hypothetical protein
MDCVDLDALGGERLASLIEEPAAVAAVGGGNVVALPSRFKVIDGGRAPAPAGVERPKMWLCRTCETDIGVATSVVEPVWQGPLREAGRVRLSSGTKRVVCTHCKMRGKLTFAD